jgi:tetratricopeptide (TPR) repeat protein
VRGLSALGSLAYWQRDPESVEAPYEESLALAREIGDRRGEAEACYNLSFSRFFVGDFAGAKELLERAADRYRELDDETNLAFANTAMGMLGYILGGDRAYHRELVEDALRTFRRKGQLWGTSQAASMVAGLAKEDGDLPRAMSGALETLEANIALGHTLGITVAVQAVALIAVEADDPELGAGLGGTIERVREQEEGEAPPLTVGLIDVRRALSGVLPEDRIAALWQEGRDASLEDAVTRSRRWIEAELAARSPGAG